MLNLDWYCKLGLDETAYKNAQVPKLQKGNQETFIH